MLALPNTDKGGAGRKDRNASVSVLGSQGPMDGQQFRPIREGAPPDLLDDLGAW